MVEETMSFFSFCYSLKWLDLIFWYDKSNNSPNSFYHYKSLPPFIMLSFPVPSKRVRYVSATPGMVEFGKKNSTPERNAKSTHCSNPSQASSWQSLCHGTQLSSTVQWATVHLQISAFHL